MVRNIYGCPTAGKSFAIRQMNNVPEDVTILDTDELRHLLTFPLFSGQFDVKNNWNDRSRFPLEAKRAYIKLLSDYSRMLDKLPGIYILFTNEPLDVSFDFVFTRTPEDVMYWLRQRSNNMDLEWPQWLPKTEFDVSQLHATRKIELNRFKFIYDYLNDITKLFA